MYMHQHFILFSIISIYFAYSKDDKKFELKELSDQKNKIWFSPRAASYLSYSFPFGEDGTKSVFGRDEGRKYIFDNEIFPKNNQKSSALRIMKEHQMWTDYDYQGVGHEAICALNTAFFMTDPAFRTLHFAGQQVCSVDRQNHFGSTVVQRYVEPGMPYEIPCYTCARIQPGLLTSFHILNRRDFLSAFPGQSFSNRIEKSAMDLRTQSSYSTSLMQLLNTVTVKHDAARLIQYVTRNNNLYSEGGAVSGNLQIEPPIHIWKSIYSKLSESEKISMTQVFGSSQTVQCALSVDNEPMSTGVVVNVDHLRNEKATEYTYDQFEKWDNSWKSFQLPNKNVQVHISWEPFSCCSACCCPPNLCGIFYTSKKCDLLFSEKTRKGYLSLKKINMNQRISLTADVYYNNYLSTLLDTAPYKQTGIPIYSSLLWSIDKQDLKTTLTELIDGHLRLRGVLPANYKGIGQFIEQRSCTNDPQKKDCALLAKCKGVSLKESSQGDDLGFVKDPCEGDDLITLTVSEKKTFLSVQTGRSYRFKIDETSFEVIGEIRWRVSLRKVPHYNRNKGCIDQTRAVHVNGKDLLLTHLNKKDTHRRIEATLANGMKIVAILTENSDGESFGSNATTIIIWTMVIIGFILGLFIFIVIVDKMRVRRAATILENKERKEALSDR